MILGGMNQSLILFYQQAAGFGVPQPAQSFQLQRRQLWDVQREAYWTSSTHDLRSQGASVDLEDPQFDAVFL